MWIIEEIVITVLRPNFTCKLSLYVVPPNKFSQSVTSTVVVV